MVLRFQCALVLAAPVGIDWAVIVSALVVVEGS